jgi:hypothetical protein
MEQFVQIIGAILILVAFAAAQFGRLDQRSVAFLVLNLIGSAILAVLAGIERQPGFLLLESVWALVSLWSLVEELRGSRTSGPATDDAYRLRLTTLKVALSSGP